MDALALLASSEFFRGISPSSLRALAAACIPKRLAKRQILFLEGQEGNSMYILAQGSVQLFKTAPDGRQVVIRTLKPGEIFGEVVLFEQNLYPVGAMALEPGLALRLTRPQVDCLLVNEEFRRERYRMALSKKDVAAAIGTIPETFSRLLLRLKRRGEVSWEGGILELKEGFWRRRATGRRSLERPEAV